jgi:hypothetical protein
MKIIITGQASTASASRTVEAGAPRASAAAPNGDQSRRVPHYVLTFHQRVLFSS